MTTLALRAIAEAGLGELAEARRVGDLERVRELSPLLEAADLLALGALADRIRAEEVGDDVLVFTRLSPHLGGDVITVGATEAGGGRAEVLRRVAIARITGSRAARVRVDWATVGIEIAQVALGFGASELQGPVLNRRGLPIAEESARKVKGAGLVSLQSLKKKELFALVRMAGRTPIAAVEGSPMPQLASPEAP